MIKKISGKVSAIHQKSLSCDLFSGFLSLEIFAPHISRFFLGEEVVFHTEMIFSEEKGYECYGFRTVEERDCFSLFRAIRGIGPRLAMSILESIHLPSLSQAVLMKDDSFFVGISGLGPKKRQFLLVELFDKRALLPTVAGVEVMVATLYKDFEEALLSMGYSKKEALERMNRVFEDEKNRNKPLPELIQKALL
jgi:Holliday junction DNA helicase RuvA